MKTSIDLDDELTEEVEKAVALTHEEPAAVIRTAIRIGLPLVARSFETPRPEGYFAQDYPLPDDRLELEKVMAQSKQAPDR